MGAVLREQNALPYTATLSTYSAEKDAIDNGVAGRDAKGANTSFCAKKRYID